MTLPVCFIYFKNFYPRGIETSWFGLAIVGPSNLLLLNTVQNHTVLTIHIPLYGTMS